MVIAKTANRNVAFKAAKIGESVFAGQSETLTNEVATIDVSIDEESLEDLGRSADLYIFNQDASDSYEVDDVRRSERPLYSQQDPDANNFQSLSLE